MLDLPSSEAQIFVSGWITDLDTTHYVRVFWTNGFDDDRAYQGVSGAEVFIQSDQFERFDLDEVSPGIYATDRDTFMAKTGQSYELNIQYQDMIIKSSLETVLPVAQLDNLQILELNTIDRGSVDGSFQNFYLRGVITDIKQERNFFRWKIMVNGIERNRPEELILFDDQFTNGNIFPFEADNVLFAESDSVELWHMSLSQRAYDYFSQLKSLTTNETFGPSIQPAQLKGNLIVEGTGEVVLGYFGASQVNVLEVQRP